MVHTWGRRQEWRQYLRRRYLLTLAQLAFLPLGAGQQNGTGLGALIGADNLFLFHLAMMRAARA